VRITLTETQKRRFPHTETVSRTAQKISLYEPNRVSLCAQASLATNHQFYVRNQILIRSRPSMALHKYINPVFLL
jgi:hypothetical protein